MIYECEVMYFSELLVISVNRVTDRPAATDLKNDHFAWM